MKEFTGITKLVVSGGGTITIHEGGVVEGARGAKLRGQTLTIEGRTETNVVIGNNITYTSGNGNVFSIGNQGYNIVTINGRRVDLSKLDDIAAGEEETFECCLDETSDLSSIVISNSAILEVPPDLLNDTFAISIKGSGDFDIPPKHFTSLQVNLMGSGDVTGDVSADILNVNLMGSGDVEGIHVRKSGSISLMGSGDVRITADDPETVSRSKMGSGDIRVKRR